MASLAGDTREPRPFAVPTRRGGFGGEGPFADWLRAVGATALLDATHPFASAMAHRAARVAAAMGLPHRRLLRPGWRAGPGDRWTRIAREEEAGRVVPRGATVLLATGRKTLMRFAGLDARLVCRRIDPPAARSPCHAAGGWSIGRPSRSRARSRPCGGSGSTGWSSRTRAEGRAGRSSTRPARWSCPWR